MTTRWPDGGECGSWLQRREALACSSGIASDRLRGQGLPTELILRLNEAFGRKTREPPADRALWSEFGNAKHQWFTPGVRWPVLATQDRSIRQAWSDFNVGFLIIPK